MVYGNKIWLLLVAALDKSHRIEDIKSPAAQLVVYIVVKYVVDYSL